MRRQRLGDCLKLPNLERFDRVEIDWIDSIETGGWQNLSEQIFDKCLAEMTSVGFYLDSDNEFIAICDALNNAKEPDRMVNNIMRIPLVAVTKVKKLK